MPKGEVFFKKFDGVTYKSEALFSLVNGSFVHNNSGVWVDVYIQWGVSFSDGSLSNLLTPAPNKDIVENKSRLEDGKRIIRNTQYVKVDDREVSLDFSLNATSRTEFFTRYDSFCADVLAKGFVEMINAYRPDKVYKLTYLSCTQFRAFINGLAKFTLKMNEPNPKDRTV